MIPVRCIDNGWLPIIRSGSILPTVSINYIEKILKSRVYDVARETPLDEAPILSRRLNNRVLLKRQDLRDQLLKASSSNEVADAICSSAESEGL